MKQNLTANVFIRPHIAKVDKKISKKSCILLLENGHIKLTKDKFHSPIYFGESFDRVMLVEKLVYPGFETDFLSELETKNAVILTQGCKSSGKTFLTSSLL